MARIAIERVLTRMASALLIKKDSLSWHYTNKDSLVCAIPKTALRDMEIVNEQELGETIAKCLGKAVASPAIPTLVVLSDEVCFSVSLKRGQETEGVKHLTSLMPFARAEVVTVRTQNQSIAAGTNRDLYEFIARILASYGYEVTLVIPWVALAALGISVHGELDRVTVRQAFDNLSGLKPFSFPLIDEGLPVATPQAASPAPMSARKAPLGWIIFISVAVLYVIGMVWFMLR